MNCSRLGLFNAGIFRIGQSASYHRAFQNVTVGDNSVVASSGPITGYRALPGWDPVTGTTTYGTCRLGSLSEDANRTA